MSVDYYMGCEPCKKALHIAQDGLGGFTFYSGQEDTMNLLGAFFAQHALCRGVVGLMSEVDIEEDEAEGARWEMRDSHGNVLPGDDPEPHSTEGD